MDIGTSGVWTRMDGFSSSEAIEFAQQVEDLGYGALWIPDAFGRDPFAHAAMLFQHTKKLVIATGVVNIHLREAQATACAQRELHDQSGGRFLLGLGVSHQTAVEPLFGIDYPAYRMLVIAVGGLVGLGLLLQAFCFLVAILFFYFLACGSLVAILFFYFLSCFGGAGVVFFTF